MNKTAIEAQIANLNAQKLQQQKRLNDARAEVNGANVSLERLEGALQLAQWVMDEVMAEEAKQNGATLTGRLDDMGNVRNTTEAFANTDGANA